MENFALGHEIKKMSYMIKRLVATIGSSEHLTPFQLEVIFFIKNSHTEIYQKDIEKELGLKRATVSLGLDSMANLDLIERKACEKDARLKEIVLTKKAIDFSDNIITRIKSLEESLVLGIDPSELLIVKNVFSKIYENSENIIYKEKLNESK